MHPARIAELLQPFLSPTPNSCHSEPGRRRGEEPAVPAALSATQLQHISTYIDLLLRWNSRINLTAIRDPENIVTRHFGESLFAAQQLFPERRAVANDQRPATNDPLRLADVGSGAGFPGIPLKLWRPELSLTLIEANHKKAAFLAEAVRALGLTDVHVITARAEDVPPGAFQVVTLRAVDRMATVVPLAASLVIPSGRIALFLTTAQVEPIRRITPNVGWNPSIPIPHSESRVLLVGKKESD